MSLAKRFAAAMSQQGLNRPARCAVAVSGGADSLALALLTQHWLRQVRLTVGGLAAFHSASSPTHGRFRREGARLAALEPGALCLRAAPHPHKIGTGTQQHSLSYCKLSFSSFARLYSRSGGRPRATHRQRERGPADHQQPAESRHTLATAPIGLATRATKPWQTAGVSQAEALCSNATVLSGYVLPCASHGPSSRCTFAYHHVAPLALQDLPGQAVSVKVTCCTGDQVEHFLLRLTRGSGLEGLAGIPVCSALGGTSCMGCRHTAAAASGALFMMVPTSAQPMPC